MLVGAQDLNQHIVLKSTPGPFGSDFISIETLENDSVSPANPPLTDPLGPELLQLNLDGSTPTFNFLPLLVVCPIMESKTSLPLQSVVQTIMSSLSPLSGACWLNGPCPRFNFN